MKFKNLFVFFLTMSLMFCLNALVASAKEDGTIEPPAQYVLKIAGEEFPIRLNEQMQLTIGTKGHNVLLTVKPTRIFNYGNVYFEYPHFYTFEADLEDPNIQMWTLSGNDAKIMIHRYRIVLTHQKFRNIMVEQYGRNNCKVEKCQIKINNKIIEGSKIYASIAGSIISQEIYSFRTNFGTTVLILQDGLSDDERSPSKEGIELKLLFEKMFQVKDEIS